MCRNEGNQAHKPTGIPSRAAQNSIAIRPWARVFPLPRRAATPAPSAVCSAPSHQPAASAMRVSPLVISIFLAACGCCWHCARLLLIPISLAGFCSGQRWRGARLEKLLICGLELRHVSLRSIRNKMAPARLINIEHLAASAACCQKANHVKYAASVMWLGFGSA